MIWPVVFKVPSDKAQVIVKLPESGILDFCTSFGIKKLSVEVLVVAWFESVGLEVIVSEETALRTEIV